MGHTKSAKKSNSKKIADKTVEVLYQKMGDRWFAFSLINGEVFMGSIGQEEIDALEAQQAAELEGAISPNAATDEAPKFQKTLRIA